MKTLEYELGAHVRAFTTTHQVDARRTNPLPLSELSGLPLNRIVIPHQVHDTRCLLIDEIFFQRSDEQRTACLEGIDAVISNLTDVLLCISTADCIPIIIYDSRHHAAAVIHAGWKGTVGRIVQTTFTQMQNAFGTQGEDCRSVIGPGISLESFEVGDEVYDLFSNAGFDMESITHRFDKWHIDLPLCNRQQLLCCDIPQMNIYVSDVCTFRDTHYFSARREGMQTGRNMTCIKL
ncbi:MAG: peptidoglycan editing factor PgeF [Bacteroidales bacterium]|nr:peptidoglycan editing factor PgeF [Bacteroidales bacterium]